MKRLSMDDISNVLTDVSVSRTADVAEVSAFSNSSKAFVAGLKDASITISGSFDATVDGYLKAILGVEGDFEFYPIGTTGGNPKASGKAIMTSYDRTPDVGGAVSFSAAFQVSGDVTEGTA